MNLIHDKLASFLLLADAVIITDGQHRILAVNSAYERITGYASHEITGKKASILRTSYTPKETHNTMKTAIHAGQPWSGVFTNRKRDGDLWHSSITITPIVVEMDDYFVGVFRELEQLESGHYLAEERISSLQSSMLKVLAISCEIRDPGIEQHLHDIGKSGIPEGILYKPGALAYYERQIVEMHTLIGRDIIDKIYNEFQDELLANELETGKNIILYHHEKWDGSGYPHQLSGEDIPIEARIVSIVDVFDALTSTRPYKEKWSVERALQLIREERGRHFDPSLVDSFLALIEQKEQPST
ncbi:HD domain-containing phosphohydrolase [Paenibacillus sp. MCAF20]